MEDTRIHQREILITLDYLLHHTDKDHPVKQTDICRYADEKYGITYQGEGVPGNQIKRQRVSECLKYLKELSDKYEFPFVLETTLGGKFYIEERNGLSEEQVARVLAAVRSDPYIGKDDTEFYEERILDAFATTEDSKKSIQELSACYLQGGEKKSEEVIQKIKILEEAYRNNCPIKVQWPGESDPEWAKVCYLKEVNHDPYVFLLPACSLLRQDGKDHYLFEKIENIVFPTLKRSELFFRDEKRKKEFADNDEMFRLSNPKLAKRYGHLDRMLMKMIPSLGEKDGVVSFCFKDVDERAISKSFESFFGEKMHYQNVENANLLLGRERDFDPREMSFIARRENRPSDQKIVHFFTDLAPFKSWLLSDPFGDGRSCIGDYVEVMSPESINVDFANYYFKKMDAYYNYLTPRQRQHLLNAKRVADFVDTQKYFRSREDDEPLDIMIRCPECGGRAFFEGENKPCVCSRCGAVLYDGRKNSKKQNKDKGFKDRR